MSSSNSKSFISFPMWIPFISSLIAVARTSKTMLNSGVESEHTPMETLSLTKEAKIYNGEKTISLTSFTGKTSQLPVKE